MRVFDGLVQAWSLTEAEQLSLLGLHEIADLEMVRRGPLDDVPTDVAERLATLLDIFRSINTLLPVPDRADAWLRRPNAHPLFAGGTALNLMLDRQGNGLIATRDYLRGQIAGP